MKKLLILSIFPILFGITSAQYYFFTGVNNYPQECTGSLEVRVNTNSMTPSVSDLYIDYGNDLSYDTSSLANMSLSTFVKGTFFTVPQVDNWLVYDSNYRRLAVFLKGTPHADTNGLMGTINFKPNQKSSAYDTVFSLYLGGSTDTNTSLWLNGVDILDSNMAQQLSKSVYTGHVVQTPCLADTNKPAISITDYDGGVLIDKTKVDIDKGLRITLTDDRANGDTPLVFDSNGNWVQNTQGINDQYGIDIEKSTVSITRGNQSLIVGASLDKLIKIYHWVDEWDGYTWRGNGERLDLTVKVPAEVLKNTPAGDGFTQWLNTYQIGMSAYEGDKIEDWGVEQLITITVKAVDRAGNEETSSIRFNKPKDPTVSQKAPTGTMINLTEPVSGKISDDWAGVKSGNIVVVLSGINEEASGYKYVFSGSQLNLTPVSGDADTDDYTYNITEHVSFPENGQIKVIVFAQDNQNNGVAYPNRPNDGLDNYTFTARPPCSEFQCCDDNIHINYSNVNILNGTSVLYTGSSLTIVGGSGTLTDNTLFYVIGDTGYIDCGLSVAGVTFYSGDTNTSLGFTDLESITGTGRATFILKSGTNIRLGYMKDHVALSNVEPYSANGYITNTDQVRTFAWTLIGSEDFKEMLGVSSAASIDLGQDWLKRYVVSVTIPSVKTGDADPNRTDPITYVYQTNSANLAMNIDHTLFAEFVYGKYLCADGYTWSFGRKQGCFPTVDPACQTGKARVNGTGTCITIPPLAAVQASCNSSNGGRWNANTNQCECTGENLGAVFNYDLNACVRSIGTNKTGNFSQFDLRSYLSTYTSGELVDGVYKVEVLVVDIEDRVSDPLTYSFEIDTTPPLCSISTTQSYMCTGGNDLTLTMTGDMTEGYSFMWSTDNTWTSGTQLTGSISTWGLYTGYVKDSAGNTGVCTIEITNPGVEISNYTLTGVYTGTITVTGLIEKMNILEGTGNENCGTGNITLSISDCVDGVVTGVISNTDTLTITLSGGVEHLDSSTTYCTVVATDSENTANTGKVYFAFDTLAPACTMAINNTECEDKVSLETLAKCEDGEEYNSDLGLCVPSCNGTLHEKGNNEYLCCPAGTLFDGSDCRDRGEFDCSDDELIVSINGVTQCKSAANMNVDDNMICAGSEQPNIQDPTVPAQTSEETERDCSCKLGSSLYYQDGKFSCKPDTAICEEGETWNGSYCDKCGEGKMYITSTILETIKSDYNDDFKTENFEGAGCYEESLFIDCHRSEEPICYGSNLPIVVTVQGGRSPVATYQWHSPSGVFGGVSVDGNVPSLVVSETGSYKLTVVDEYGNEGECLPTLEITGSRLDMIAPIVTGNNISGYECQIITGSVSVTDEGCAGDWTYRWYDTTGLISGVTTGEYGLYQTVTGTQTRDVVVADILGNQAITGTVSYTWEDLPLYINTGSYDLGTMLPEEGEVDEYVVPVPSTGLDVIDLFEAQEMSGDVTCGVGTGITLDSFACDLEFVTGAIDETTGSIVNIIVGEYASATGVSCTGTISDDDGNSTGFELTFDVGREGLIIGTPESIQGIVAAGDRVSMKGFWIQDKRGWDTGHYTTIQSRGLTNTSNGDTISVTIISKEGSSGSGMLTQGTPNATAVNSALWEENGGIEFGADSDPVLYFYRPNDPNNGGVKNFYQDELDLLIPQDATAGTYTGEIVFTLYDRPFDAEINNNDGVYWNESQGLISIVKNGVAQYTLQDKNLGAEYAYTGIDNPDTYGKYYQWGNNYGFTPTQLNNPGLVGQYNSTHRPNQLPRSIDMFWTGSFYDSSDNLIQQLWGVPQGGVVTNGLLNKGPCDGGYHVPTHNQWTGLLALLDMHSTELSNALKLPFAGHYDGMTVEQINTGSLGTYWMADWYNQGAVNLTIRNGNIRVIYGGGNGIANQLDGNSVRCFKETVVDPTGDGWTKLTAL